MIQENKKYKNLQYYIKKINNYLLLIDNEELNDDEKELLLNKMKKINEKLEFIKKAEELNIQEIKRKEKKINDERLLNQYKAYLTNKNIYLNFKEKSENIPNEFKHLYNCFIFVETKFQLSKENDIDNKKITDITDDFYLFINTYNKNEYNNPLFNIFSI